MIYLGSIMLIIFNAVCLVLVVFGLPGNWLIVTSTCLFAWWRWEDGVFSIYTLIAIAAGFFPGTKVRKTPVNRTGEDNYRIWQRKISPAFLLDTNFFTIV